MDKNTMDEIKEDQMKVGQSGKMNETLQSTNKNSWTKNIG